MPKLFKHRKDRTNVIPAALRPSVYYYEWDEYNEAFRWWFSLNASDVFDMIGKEQLAARLKAAADLGIRTVDHLPGFCDLGNDCPDHRGWH
jgi:hypothetical protein